MEFKDYYQVLGVARDVSEDDLKKAFRRQARKYHPDVSKESDAEERMKEINEAFAVLSDPEKRAAYDQVGQGFRAGQDFRPPPDWDAGFEFSGGERPSAAEAAAFSDFFSELFGSRMGGGHAGAGTRFEMRGEDHHAKIMLDLEDAYRGAVRTLTLRAPVTDPQGRVRLAEHSVEVRIPKGVYEGQLIRLAGKGNPGIGGGAPGDLYLEVHFNEQSRYRVDGRDVYVTLPVAPWEAALGAQVQAPLPDGAVEVRIPEGSQSGRKLRLRGRGIPASAPGDLYLELDIALPPASDQKGRDAYQAMAREFASFNPRQGQRGQA